MGEEYAQIVKTLVVGSSGVGKTCLLLRYTDRIYKESYSSTIGVDFKIKNVNVDGVPIKMQIWDTAGQERFRTITSSYYRNANGIILVFDITDRHTFRDLKGWINEINNNTTSPVVILILGNKVDIAQEAKDPVKKEEVEEFMETYKGSEKLRVKGYHEVSAREDVMVSQSFEEMAQLIKRNVPLKANGSSSIRLDGDLEVEGSKCCIG